MTDYTPNFTPEDSIEETRRKKLEEFKRTFDPDAIRGEYDEPAAPADYTAAAEPAAEASVPAYDPDGSYIPGPEAVEPYPAADDLSYASEPAAYDSYAGEAAPDAAYAPASPREPLPVDFDHPGTYASYSTDDTPLTRRRRNDEINSFSNSDAKKRIERDSKKALKQQKKEEKRIEKSKAKRNRRIFKLVWLTMVVIVAIIIAQYIIVGVNDMLAITRSEDVHTVNISIPANPTIDKIADILYSNGVIGRPNFFKMYTKLTSSEKGFRQGEFKLDTNKDYEAIVNTLQSNSSRTDIVKVQLTEGMSVWEIATLLHEQGVTTDIYAFLDMCNSDIFDEDYTFLQGLPTEPVQYHEVDGHQLADAYKLEGYLFPDTYEFYLGEDPELTIDKLLSNYENKIVLHKEKYFGNSKKSSLAEEAEKSGYSVHDILTIASIIQAEAASREDMYYISSILHNRLEYGPAYGVSKLNCDCTLYYPWREQTDIPESLRSSYTSRYDTNTFEGLPPGPICNPGEEAIKAALHPYESDYLFFCHDTPENGSTPYYATTLEEHNYYLSVIGK